METVQMRSSMLLPTVTLASMLAGCDGTTERRVESDVAAHLVSPESARFRNVHEVSPTTWTGEVDAKTGGGTYAGFMPFTWTRVQGKDAEVAIATY
jgi:hypothetical protein